MAALLLCFAVEHFLIKLDWVIFRATDRRAAGQRLWVGNREDELGAVAKRGESENPEETFYLEGQCVQTSSFIQCLLMY